ncbi:MAG: class I SAM-dependent methyltransferase [Pirellulales bacterium]
MYDQHENDPRDLRYRQFLNQLAEPLISRLEPGMEGLDYGCGPGPALSVMLEESGMAVKLYDPYFAPDNGVLARTYDFVTCSEVAEHFYQPAKDWCRLVSLLSRGSWLGVMTRLRDDCGAFEAWYYKKDPTHVSFYHSTTIDWLADHYGLTVAYRTHNVSLFLKS